MWYLPFDSSGKPGAPVAFRKTEFNESMGQFSPDGHWVAYVSNDAGQFQVYVRPFPQGGGPVRISSTYGFDPRWRADGKELYYLSGPGLMAVSVQYLPGGRLQAGVPKALFNLQIRRTIPEANLFSYSPSADGQRFLMNLLPDTTAAPTLNVITNWDQPAMGAAKEP
jgi:eukaryotic-like serine/threonine-protein kinase